MCEAISAISSGFATAAKVIAVIASVASAAVSTVSSIQSANAQKEQYKYQAEVNKQNAEIVQENASKERQQGIEEARLQRLKAQQNVASQTSAMAANGIDVTQGTAVKLLGDTAMWGEMDALNTLTNSESRARALEAEAGNFKNQARLDSLAGQNAYRAGQIGAISSGLNGISNTFSVADKWYDFSGRNKSGTALNTNPTGIRVKSSMRNAWAYANNIG